LLELGVHRFGVSGGDQGVAVCTARAWMASLASSLRSAP
jgi:hypothetical protein